MATASIYPSIHPSWQCFKGICSFLMNVIKARKICDADSMASLTSPVSWEFAQFYIHFFFNIHCSGYGPSVSVPLWRCILKGNRSQLLEAPPCPLPFLMLFLLSFLFKKPFLVLVLRQAHIHCSIYNRADTLCLGNKNNF